MTLIAPTPNTNVIAAVSHSMRASDLGAYSRPGLVVYSVMTAAETVTRRA